MRDFATLPHEILRFVFEKLTKPNIYECMKTCKEWYSEASVIYHFDIRARPKEQKTLLQVCKQTRLDGSKIGDYARVLALYGFNFLDESEFHQLIHNLPNLQSIRIDNKYIDFIKSAPKEDLKCIKEILMQHVSDFNLIPTYYSTNLKYKDQILGLNLENLDIYSEDRRNERFLTEMSEFKKLEHLNIGDKGSRDTNGIQLTSLLNHCRSIKSLHLTRKHHWLVLPTDDNHVHENLTSLRLKIGSLSEDNLRYIIDYIPNLKSFDLVLTTESLEGRLACISQTVANDFIQYLKKLDTLQFERYWVNGDGVRVTDDTEYHRFWAFLKEFCGNEGYCNLNVNLSPDDHWHDGIYVKKENRDITVVGKMICDLYDDSWIKEIDFFTFTDISMDHGYGTGEDLYRHTIRLIFELLKKQKDTFCPLFLKDGPQVLSICRPESPTHGALDHLDLHNGLLHSLGELYPSIESLSIKNCWMIFSDNCIDLSRFINMHQLTLDATEILGAGSFVSNMFIQFIHVNEPSKFICYKVDHGLSQIEDSSILDNPRVDLIKIINASIRTVSIQTGGSVASIELMHS